MSDRWFISLKNRLERAYLQYDEPWKQSGFMGTIKYWEKARRPILKCIKTSGALLDIGCANGYLLECLMKWGKKLSLEIIPYGLDLSEKLVALAIKRHPVFKSNFHVGNGWTWDPPIQFEYVRTELGYVPRKLQQKYIERIKTLFLKENGTLLLTEYRSRNVSAVKPWNDLVIEKWGYSIKKCASGFFEGKEVTRVLSIRHEDGS
ncbi:MAG: class I SAM-dependent methyltransferase [Candidatus Lokiarchaeota archaeon]|nr:class I SAM-dependent methyltransferase [Candidatus Lokiarchaeota archaeon]